MNSHGFWKTGGGCVLVLSGTLLWCVYSWWQTPALEGLALPEDGRSLTPEERVQLRSVFHDLVDYSAVRIQHKSMPAVMTAIVFRDRILFRSGYYVDDFSQDYLKMALLVHEVAHVWQSQRDPGYTLFSAMTEHLINGDDVYRYKDDGFGLRALSDFGYEQQGRILADYYIQRHLGESVQVFEETINQSIQR